MRGLLFIPLALLAVIGGGVAVCAAAGWNVHAREMLVAAVSSGIACGLGFLPIILARNASQDGVAQAGLLGTLVHLLGHVIVAGYVILAKPPLHPSFIWWLMPFYWLTLAALATAFVRQVRQAPVGAAK
jgi:hypothetical protein